MMYGLYKQSFYRYVLSLCGGTDAVRALCAARERGALLYDVYACRFALYSELMDAKTGMYEVGYISNGVVERVQVFCPMILSMTVITDSIRGARPGKVAY